MQKREKDNPAASEAARRHAAKAASRGHIAQSLDFVSTPGAGYHSVKKQRVRLSDQLRQAVDASGWSRRRICLATGIDEGAFSRFMAGKVGLELSNVDLLADLLDINITAPRGQKAKSR
jgi:hypothetical protein